MWRPDRHREQGWTCPVEAPAGLFRKESSRNSGPLWWRLAFACTVIVAALALRLGLILWVLDFPPYLFQLPAIIVVSLVCGAEIGLAAIALLAGVNAALVPESGSSGIASPALASLLSFVINAIAVWGIAALVRTTLRRLESAMPHCCRRRPSRPPWWRRWKRCCITPP